MGWLNWLDNQIEEKGSIRAVARFIGVSEGTIRGWRRGNLPSVGSLQSLANHYHRSLHYFMVLTGQAQDNSDPVSPSHPGPSEPDADELAEIIMGALQRMTSAQRKDFCWQLMEAVADMDEGV